MSEALDRILAGPDIRQKISDIQPALDRHIDHNYLLMKGAAYSNTQVLKAMWKLEALREAIEAFISHKPRWNALDDATIDTLRQMPDTIRSSLRTVFELEESTALPLETESRILSDSSLYTTGLLVQSHFSPAIPLQRHRYN